MRELISLFRELIGKRKLVTELAKADFRKRFVGSYFGIVWMFIQPMVTIAIYAFIFGEHGMKNAPPVPGKRFWLFDLIDNDKVTFPMFRWIDPQLLYVIHVPENLIFKI